MRYAFVLIAIMALVGRRLSAQQDFTVQAGASRIDVSFDEDLQRLSPAQLKRWVQNAADAVVAYYGRFPVPHVELSVRTFHSSGVRGARTFPASDGGRIRIGVGRESTGSDLASDWTLTHELVHLTFPSMADDHHWIEEGISTYVEPIARVQAGQFDAARMWFEVVRDLPKGLPESGDHGLDHTHTWGRTYWGGALFCFLADIEIRKQTQNKKGLQDALRAILGAGGDIRQEWNITRALEAGDHATGTRALINLYNQMKDQPHPVDLDPIWKDLGISKLDSTVQFRDDAPLAAIRKSITATK